MSPLPTTRRARRSQGLDARQTALVHRVAGIVLDYPGADLIAQIPDLRTAVAGVPDPARSALAGVLDHLEHTPLTQLTADYVEGFDMRRRACLYLTYYGHGDTRQRGVGHFEPFIQLTQTGSGCDGGTTGSG